MTLADYGRKAQTAAGLARLHTVPGKHFPQEDQAAAIASQIARFIRAQQPATGPDPDLDAAANP